MFSPFLGFIWSPWELTHHTHTERPSIAAGMVDWQRGAGGSGLVQTLSRHSRARASAICHQLQHLQIQGALDGRCHHGPLRISAGGRVGREAAPRTLITSSSLIITVWAFFIIVAVPFQDCLSAYLSVSYIRCQRLTPCHTHSSIHSKPKATVTRKKQQLRCLDEFRWNYSIHLKWGELVNTHNGVCWGLESLPYLQGIH